MDNQFLMDVGMVSENLVIFYLILDAEIFPFLKVFLQYTILDENFFLYVYYMEIKWSFFKVNVGQNEGSENGQEKMEFF